MGKEYFALTFSPSMLIWLMSDGQDTGRFQFFTTEWKFVTPEHIKARLATGKVEVIANPSHVNTLTKLKERYGIDVDATASKAKVNLAEGDTLYLAFMDFGRRLNGGEDYSDEEVQRAGTYFIKLTVSAC